MPQRPSKLEWIKTDTYVGPDRRRGPRRVNGERRELLRYEPDRPNRRSRKDRRQGAGAWDSLHTL